MDSPLDETYPRTIDELRGRLRDTQDKFDHALNRLSDKQRTTPGDDGWTVKDHLAHLAAWERGIAALLQRRPRWAAMGLDEGQLGSEEKTNEALRQQAARLSLDEAQAALQAAHQALFDALDHLEDQDLFRPYRDFDPGTSHDSNDDPVIGWIIGNSYGHLREHLPWIKQIAAEV